MLNFVVYSKTTLKMILLYYSRLKTRWYNWRWDFWHNIPHLYAFQHEWRQLRGRIEWRKDKSRNESNNHLERLLDTPLLNVGKEDLVIECFVVVLFGLNGKPSEREGGGVERGENIGVREKAREHESDFKRIRSFLH